MEGLTGDQDEGGDTIGAAVSGASPRFQSAGRADGFSPSAVLFQVRTLVSEISVDGCYIFWLLIHIPGVNVANPLSAADVVAAFREHEVSPTPLGEGGMKSAFLIRADKPSVLKVVREPVQEDPLEGAVGLPERIRREIEGMRAISHPGVVQIVAGPDTRTIGGGLHVWYIEPFFDGGSLAERLDEPWPEAECVRLLGGLVDAAEALAQHNTVHRDIKPSNIVFDVSQRPVLLDLGIAYFQDLTPLTDSWGISPRTPMYAAPEQFEMRLHSSIDFRTDLFLIGLVDIRVADWCPSLQSRGSPELLRQADQLSVERSGT